MSQSSLTTQQQAELISILELTQVARQQMQKLCEQAEAKARKLEKGLDHSQPKGSSASSL
ncbi:MAG: hypothetical protein JO235_19210 [Chroococcidiopsidaceae cyanobacterium CP_BM_RX_35]|nr:hypothetical protein [Chroococcidiopsidaceae cyanobacterium CP_BM_RX_35]